MACCDIRLEAGYASLSGWEPEKHWFGGGGQEQPMWPFANAKKTLEPQVGSDDSPKPICPYCEQETETLIVHRSHLGGFSNMNVFSCPRCRKVLSVTATQK
jgi:hypothetical protein